ncbi:MAG: Peptidyl-tRNA hydrolase ArfB [Phycisphaerae bacterium]|nr:Peptidyl-tRNA hydrolase ArfB [Phycisphaerae bacterium]
MAKLEQVQGNKSKPLINPAEVRYQTARSPGPGGQNVNKVETQVTILFEPAKSPSLTDEQKRLIIQRLSNRISREGVLRVTARKFRSQQANRELAWLRLLELLEKALTKTKQRHATAPTRGSRLRRLEQKQQVSHKKRQRRPPANGE